MRDGRLWRNKTCLKFTLFCVGLGARDEREIEREKERERDSEL